MKSKQVALSLAILLALGTGTVLHVEAQGNPTEYSRHFGVKTRLPVTIVWQ